MTDAAADARRADINTDDHSPTCPSCQELSTAGAKWCESCDTWLLDRGPSAPELADRQANRREVAYRLLLAGDAPPRREDTQPTKETEGF